MVIIFCLTLTVCYLTILSLGELNLKQTDEDFLKQLAKFEVRRHIRGLRFVAENRFPGRRFEEMGFHVHFTEPQNTIIDVQPHETFKRVNADLFNMKFPEESIKDGTLKFVIVHYPYHEGYTASHLPLGSIGVTPGVNLAPPSCKEGITTEGAMMRSPAYDLSGEPLQCDYDEIDEILKTVRCFELRKDTFSIAGQISDEDTLPVETLRLIALKYKDKPMWNGNFLRDTIKARMTDVSWPFILREKRFTEQ